ncbi:hypothetical protein Tco_1198281, partial [Tanacetum coccineum]
MDHTSKPHKALEALNMHKPEGQANENEQAGTSRHEQQARYKTSRQASKPQQASNNMAKQRATKACIEG